jgi:hypothetical protein
MVSAVMQYTSRYIQKLHRFGGRIWNFCETMNLLPSVIHKFHQPYLFWLVLFFL